MSGRSRVPSVFALVALVAIVIVVAGRGPGLPRAMADPDKWGPGYKDLQNLEARSILPLMRGAAKSDFRRQARYLADRVLAAEPGQHEASELSRRWSEDDLQQGQAPDAAWAKQRDATLKGLGEKYFHFCETLNGKGMNPVDYWVLVERALAYGGFGAALTNLLDQQDYSWMGTWGSTEKKPVYDKIGTLLETVTFPPEFDDEYLRVHARWREARVAKFRCWRMYTDLPAEDAMHAVYSLMAEENHLVQNLVPPGAKEDETYVIDLYLVTTAEAYDRLAGPAVHPEDKEKFQGTSGWRDRWKKQLFVLAKHRDNPWIGDDAVLQGFAAPVLLRRHTLGGGGVQGRGAWLLDGISGAYEGFVPPLIGQEGGDVVPAKCWRLAAARELRERVALLPWEQLLETDLKAAESLPKKIAKFKFLGAEREGKNIDVVACQATAFVLGVLQADAGKGAAKLVKLLDDLYKRDRLPDFQKAIGWKDERVFAEANKAMDSVAR